MKHLLLPLKIASLMLFSVTAYHTYANANAHTHKHSAEKVTLYTVAKGTPSHNIGYVLLKDSPNGLLILPHLSHVPAGFHGFHIHVNPSCKDHGMAAGWHYDPTKTGKHLGPYGRGHLGDLPVLYANKKGDINGPVIAPHLTLKQIHGRSLMLHAGGDNYADKPESLGGGGARFACGIIH